MTTDQLRSARLRLVPLTVADAAEMGPGTPPLASGGPCDFVAGPWPC